MTKGAKTYPTFFFPVGDDIVAEFQGYVRHLRSTLTFGADDPLFPSTRKTTNDGYQFEARGITREHWMTPDPVRDIFKLAFERAGIPPFTPHTLRKTLTRLGQRTCQTAEEFKAWSQNLGHSEVMTTLTSYGAVSATRQAQVLGELGRPKAPSINPAALLRDIAASLDRSGGLQRE